MGLDVFVGVRKWEDHKLTPEEMGRSMDQYLRSQIPQSQQQDGELGYGFYPVDARLGSWGDEGHRRKDASYHFMIRLARWGDYLPIGIFPPDVQKKMIAWVLDNFSAYDNTVEIATWIG